MLAVIKTGGKQYVVSPGQKLKIEKLEAEVGKEVIFDQVLLTVKEGATSAKASASQVVIGAPLVEGVKVVGKVLNQGKADKVIALRYKAKKRVSVKKGHRQQFTEVEITKVA
ncbi:MAG: 50S ribosomal protein L21 [Candidatus Pacebacteria bacterium]|nr:50S ribosomal protein L21 [Candidatus Paceibacterota bacterium]